MRNFGLRVAKSFTLVLLTMFILGAGAFVTNIAAQTSGDFEIEVPFDFVVAGRTFAAAKYRVGRLDKANPDTLVLKSSNDKTLAIFLTQRLSSGTSSAFSRLTFRLEGDTHLLDTVRASGQSYESRVPAKRSDRRRPGDDQLAKTVSIISR